jgi:hypothetical protein
MSETLPHNALAALIEGLDPASSKCRAQISVVRQLMDVSCDTRTISIRQRRELLEHISLIQGRCLAGESKVPNGQTA